MSIFRNSATVIAGRGVEVAFQFLAAIVLARLLSPEEFGVFAVSAGAVGLLYAIREFGASNYLVRAEKIDRQHVGSVLTISLAIALSLAAAILLLAPDIAEFFDDERIEPVLNLFAVNFMLSPAAMLVNALLVREQRFMLLTTITVTTGAFGAFAMIILAWFGVGPIALALGTTLGSVTFIVLGVIAKPRGLLFVPSVRHVRSVVRFGGWLTAVSLCAQFAERSAELVVGRILGLGAAGIFDKGNSLLRMVLGVASPVLHSVVFSAVAKENRAGTLSAADYLLRFTVLGVFLWPVFFFLAYMSDALVLLLFGPQWGESALVLSALAFNSVVLTPALLGDQVLIVRDRLAGLFFQKLVFLFLKLCVLLLLSRFGLFVLAIGLVVPSLVYFWLNQRAVLKELGGSWVGLGHAILPGLVFSFLSVSCAVAGVAVGAEFVESSAFAEVIVAGFGFLFGWIIATYVVPSPVRLLRQRALAWGRTRLRKDG